MNRGEIFAKCQELAPWFHNINLGEIWTKSKAGSEGIAYPNQLWQAVLPLLPPSLEGLDCLDIGCGAGYMSFEMAKMGGNVTGIDSLQFPKALEQAEFCKSILNSSAKFIKADFLDWTGLYDVVLFLGVLYHTEDYERSIRKLRELAKVCIIESLVMKPEGIMEVSSYNGDKTIHWVASKNYISRLLIESKFTIKQIVDRARPIWKVE